jgi:hypothetical protein
VFASASDGLYLRIADTSWTRFPDTGGGLLENRGFVISPYDTSVWVTTLTDADMVGAADIRISHNSGQNWSVIYLGGFISSLLWSPDSADVFYFRQDYELMQANWADSTFRPLLSFPYDAITNLTCHPQQPWIYACANHNLGRYDESTGDTLNVPVPFPDTYAVSAAYTENGLLVSTSRGFYSVSDDLSDWQSIADTVNTNAWGLLYTAPDLCLAGGFDGLYKAGGHEALSPMRPPTSMLTVTVYPNPSNGGFVVLNDRPEVLRIYDLLGREVYSQQVERAGSVWLELPGLGSGTYFLTATSLVSSRDNSPTVKITLVK